jgi:membrane protease YdiL (CAAX protease family)
MKKKGIMNNRLDVSGGRHWPVWSSLYATVVLAFAGFLNYTEPYSSDPVTTPILWQLILWGALYLPIVILPIVAGLKVTDFGFTLNPLLALAVSLIVTICAFWSPTAIVTWRSALIGAFARTGEEIFFRGFLFVLFSEIFRNKRRPWLWAAIVSSMLFALAHTQTFQPGYLAQYGSPSMPVGYQIFERLLNVFGLAFTFALIRVWTHSILPGAIAHSLLAGGIATLPFVLLIYGVATFWAHRRAEPVILQTNGLGRLA